MINVSVDYGKSMIRFEHRSYSQNDLLVASSIGISMPSPGLFDVYLERVCKVALYKFMIQINPGFLNIEEHKDVFATISKMYSPIYEERYNVMRRLIPFFDNLKLDQKETCIMSFYSKYLYAAFEPGVGKSLAALSITLLHNETHNVIVCKKTAKITWKNELIKWGVSNNDIFVVGSKNNPINCTEKFIILSHRGLTTKIKQLRSRKITHLIIDEAHKAKNVKADIYKRAEEISLLKRPRITFMSGTPQTNWTDDWFASLKLSNHPLGKSLKRFKSLFCKEKQTPWGLKVIGSKEEDLLNACLSNFVRRNVESKRALVGVGVYYEVVMVPMETYKAEYNNLLAKFKESGKTDAQLKQILISMLRISALSKVSSAIEIISDTIHDLKKKIIVFSTFIDVIHQIKEHFGDQFVAIHGSVNDAQRAEALRRFKEDPTCMGLIGQTEAAGESVDGLQTVCSEFLMVDIPIIPKNIEQPVSRLDRIGQTEDVNCKFLVADGTVDEKVLNLVGAKELSKNKVMTGKSETFNFKFTELDLINSIKEDGQNNKEEELASEVISSEEED